MSNLLSASFLQGRKFVRLLAVGPPRNPNESTLAAQKKATWCGPWLAEAVVAQELGDNRLSDIPHTGTPCTHVQFRIFHGF